MSDRNAYQTKSNRAKNEYKRANHSVHACDYHIIWCTKYRKKWLSPKIQDRLKEIIEEKQEDYNYEVIAIETMSDHIHLLVSIAPHFNITEIIGKIKGYSSHILRREFRWLRCIRSLWTSSKFVSSAGGVTLPENTEYLSESRKAQNQEINGMNAIEHSPPTEEV